MILYTGRYYLDLPSCNGTGVNMDRNNDQLISVEPALNRSVKHQSIGRLLEFTSSTAEVGIAEASDIEEMWYNMGGFDKHWHAPSASYMAPLSSRSWDFERRNTL